MNDANQGSRQVFPILKMKRDSGVQQERCPLGQARDAVAITLGGRARPAGAPATAVAGARVGASGDGRRTGEGQQVSDSRQLTLAPGEPSAAASIGAGGGGNVCGTVLNVERRAPGSIACGFGIVVWCVPALKRRCDW